MSSAAEILLVTGPAGVGKSVLCWELGHQLEEAQVPHVVIESDELDRAFPKPSAKDLERIVPGASDISGINLATIWSNYRNLGHTRLIMSGVMVHLDFDRRWIGAAIPDAQITVVRLQAMDATLIGRLEKREIGSGRDAQIKRSLQQAKRIATEQRDGLRVIATDGRALQEIAATLLRDVGWLPLPDDRRPAPIQG